MEQLNLNSAYLELGLNLEQVKLTSVPIRKPMTKIREPQPRLHRDAAGSCNAINAPHSLAEMICRRDKTLAQVVKRQFFWGSIFFDILFYNSIPPSAAPDENPELHRTAKQVKVQQAWKMTLWTSLDKVKFGICNFLELNNADCAVLCTSLLLPPDKLDAVFLRTSNIPSKRHCASTPAQYGRYSKTQPGCTAASAASAALVVQAMASP